MNRKFVAGRAGGLSLVVCVCLLAACGAPNEAELLRSARAYLERNDSRAAAIQAKVALQKNPQLAEARYVLGVALLRSGDASGAVIELERARSLRHDDASVLPVLANAMVVAGQSKQVVEKFADTGLPTAAAQSDLQAAVAAAYGVLGQFDKSEAAGRKAVAANPNNHTARLLLARLTAGRGAIDDALTMTESVLLQNPKQAAAGLLKAQLLWIGKGDPKAAESALRAALQADPALALAHSTLMSLLLSRGDFNGFREQVAALRKALPNSPTSLFYDTELALFQNDLEHARRGAQQLLKSMADNAATYHLAGAIELQQGALPLAQSYLSKALQLSPELTPARLELAETYNRMGQPDRALGALRPLLENKAVSTRALSLAGESQLLAGDFRKAEAYFEAASRADPADTKIRTALFLAQMSQQGQTDQGFARLESLAAADATGYADLALVSAGLRTQRFDAALKAVSRLQAKWPDKALPPMLLGRIQHQQGDLVAARASYEKAAAIDSSYFPALASLATLDLDQHNQAAAQRRFEAVLAREPGNYRALMAIADLQRLAGAPIGEIVKPLLKAVAAHPAEPAPRLMLIQQQLAAGAADAALAQAQTAVAAVPDNTELLDMLGRAQLMSGALQQSISTFRKVAEAQPASAEPYVRLAEAYVQAKDLPSAEQSLRRAVQIAPSSLTARRGLIQIALANKRPDDAVALARSVQKEFPKQPAGYLMEGEVQAAQQHWELAVKAFAVALDQDKASTDLAIRLHAVQMLAGRRAEADRFTATWERDHPADSAFQSYLGAQALERRDYPAAEQRYRKVLASRPDDPVALNNVAWLLLRQGQPGALALVDKANQLAPNRPEIMDTLAAVLAADRQLSKALEWQRKAVDTAPAAPAYRLRLAQLLIDSKERDAARAELELLSKLGPAFSDQPEVTRMLKTL